MPTAVQQNATLRPLYVFREINGVYERIGILRTTEKGTSFAYEDDFANSASAQSISLSLPLREQPYFDADAPAFFEGLLPEGILRRELANVVRANELRSASLLAQLNNESIGGLVFNAEKEMPLGDRTYAPIEFDAVADLSEHPVRTALEMGISSRLSLAGAQTKIGLYHTGSDYASGWFRPEGSAPSNTIVKAATSAFPHQTINEAFCLSVARLCGFDVARAELIPTSREPLIALERFDRPLPEKPLFINGLAAPVRLHQEDFCQAAGLPSHRKYEPTNGQYLALGSRLLSRTVSNPFGDKMMFFDRVLFDYLIGNCDNHLKNNSILWDGRWSARELSPLYDITCTTMYSALAREMGISLCESRRIDDVTAKDIRSAAMSAGVSGALGWEHYLSLRDEFRAALPQAEQEIAERGFPEVHELAAFIRKDSAVRCAL